MIISPHLYVNCNSYTNNKRHNTHRDVHPIGASFDEITNATLSFGAAIKEACGKKCEILGPTTCCWCGYFTSGLDKQNGNCYGGKDRESHGNLTLLQYYLQEAAAFEKKNGYRLLDYLDVHYYPGAQDVSFNCDESNMNVTTDRLNAPRSLYDPNYIDPSWINRAIVLIPMLREWIDQYYPGTKLAVSEYNFGGDDCITSAIAHCETLAIFATYGVNLGTRWSKPKPNTLVTDAFKVFMNYDGKGSSILDTKGMNVSTLALGVLTDDIEKVTGYAFYTSDKKNLYIYVYNKVKGETQVDVKFDGQVFNTAGDIDLYGIDDNVGLRYIGKVDNKTQSGFTVDMPQWSVRLAVIKQ